KVCHNLLLGVVAQSLAEIAVLAEKAGISRADLLEFINGSVMGSLFTRYKTPAYVKADFTPTFTPVLLRKDFDLGVELARDLGVPLPVAASAQQVAPSVDPALLEAYGRMVLIREFEQAIHRLFLRVEVHGTTHLSAGQEAIPVGVCLALEAGDYVSGTYRGHGHALANGTDPEALA